MRQFFKSKAFRIAAVAALLLGVYAIAGIWVAPKLVRSALEKEIPKTMSGVNPTMGDIRINPFLFQVEIKNFYLTGSNRTKLVGFSRLFVDFQMSSIWHRAYTFSHIEMTAPFANAVIFKDGSVNLSQLSPKSPEKPQPKLKDAKPIPALRIGSFQDRAFLTDTLRGAKAAFVLTPVDVSMPDVNAEQRKNVAGIAAARSVAQLVWRHFRSNIGWIAG